MISVTPLFLDINQHAELGALLLVNTLLISWIGVVAPVVRS